MKYLVIASACAALLATPALAQSGYGNDAASAAAGSSAPAQTCSTVPDAKAGDPCPPAQATAKPPTPDVPLSVAAEHTSGMIASIDVAASTITLDDGKTFDVPTDFALKDLKTGEKVTIAFSQQAGKLMAKEVITRLRAPQPKTDQSGRNNECAGVAMGTRRSPSRRSRRSKGPSGERRHYVRSPPPVGHEFCQFMSG